MKRSFSSLSTHSAAIPCSKNKASTEYLIVMEAKRFGYDPRINNPKTFNELYEDLCANDSFRRWLNGIIEPTYRLSEEPLLRQTQIYEAHEWMSNHSPVWSRRFHILLSVIVSGNWDDYSAE